MASPPMQWEEFASQALHVHRLLSEHVSAADSPEFLTRISEPHGLLQNCSDTPTTDIHLPSSQTYNKVLCGCNHKEVLTPSRTPLKDASNTVVKTAGLSWTRITETFTHEKPADLDKSVSIQCPSSAELKEFLDGIMEVSPLQGVNVMDSFETKEVEKKQCAKDHQSCTGLQKLSTARNIDNNVSPAPHSFTVNSISQDEVLTQSLQYHMVKQMPINSENNSDQHLLMPSSTKLETKETSSIKFARKGTSNLQSYGPNNPDDVLLVLEAEPHLDAAASSLVFDMGDSYVGNFSSHAFDKIREKESKILEVFKDEDHINSSDIADNERGAITVKEHLVHVAGKEEQAQSVHSSAELKDLVKSQSVKTSACHLPASGTSENTNVEKNQADFCFEGQKERQNMVNASLSQVKDVKHNLISDEDLEVEEFDCAVGSGLSGTFDDQEDSQQKPIAHPGKDPVTKKEKLPSLNVPSKIGIKGQESRRSTGLPVKAPATKLPLMKPRQSQSKSSQKRSSVGTMCRESQLGVKSDNASGVKVGDASILSKNIPKPPTGTCRLARKESLGPIKASSKEVKPLVKQIPKPGETSRLQLKISQLPDKPRFLTKVSGQQIVKVVQSSVNKPSATTLQKSDPSRTVTKLSRRSSMKEKQPRQFPMAAKANTASAIGDGKPGIPVPHASRTVTKETKKGPIKALLPITKCAPGTKATPKTPPAKAIFPVYGSLTVTKQHQPLGAKTVTKEEKCVDPKTVTKASRESLSGRPALNTPMKCDSHLVPRRLSDIFTMPSKQRESCKKGGRNQNSGIPTPTKSSCSSRNSSKNSSSCTSSFRTPSSLSDFSSPSITNRGSANDADAFRPRQALVKNTPDVEPRRQSLWSPVKKNQVLAEDMPYYCTKRIRGIQKSTS